MDPTSTVEVEVMSMEELERGKTIQTDIQMISEVISNVRWTEPWLVVLLTFHFITFLTIILARKRTYLLGGILVTLGGLCYISEQINEWCANNWKQFSSQQYFDSIGLFISVIYSLPLLFNCFLILVCLLLETCVTLQTVAQMKIKATQKELSRKKQERPSETSVPNKKTD